MVEIRVNNDPPALRYVLYARKSSEDSRAQVKSIPDQIEDCMNFARAKGLIVVDVVKEAASAKKSKNRPLFTKMLKDFEKKKYDGIIAWHPDRLSRNSLESGMIVDMVDNDVIKDLKFPTMNFENTASGKMLLGILFTMSKEYSEHLSENVKRGMDSNLQQGKSSGVRKWGYQRNNTTGLYEPDENFNHIRRVWDIVIDGGTQRDALAYVKLHDVHMMTKINERNKVSKRVGMDKGTISRILKDPFYYGILIQAGTKVDLREVTPNFKPMISEAEYLAVQEDTKFKARRTHPLLKEGETDKEQVFIPFRKFIRCKECGRFMYASRSKSRHGDYFLYYCCRNPECSHPQGQVRGKIVVDYMCSVLETLKASEPDYKSYSRRVEKYINKKLDDLQFERHSLTATKSKLERALRELSERYGKLLENPNTPKIVLDQINEQLEDTQTKIIDLNEELQKVEARIFDPDQLRMSQENFTNLILNGADKMRAGSSLEKDILARRIFTNLEIGAQKRLFHLCREPFNFLVNDDKFLNGWG